jgi:hypothetical protein
MLRTIATRTARRMAVAAVILTGLSPLVTMTSGQAPDVMTDRPMAPHSPSAALAAHPDCWVGEAPADQRGRIPGAVIWQHPDGRTVYSRRLVGPALDAMFADGSLPGRPIAFCPAA